MYLLAECDALIYSSRSTFGTVALLLSNIPKRNSIDVDRLNPLLAGKKIFKWLVA